MPNGWIIINEQPKIATNISSEKDLRTTAEIKKVTKEYFLPRHGRDTSIDYRTDRHLKSRGVQWRMRRALHAA